MTRTPERRVTPALTPTRRPHGTARGVWDSCRNLGVDRERPISDLPDPLATAVGGESRDFSLSAHFEQLFSFFAVSIRMTECCSGLAHDHHALYLHIPPHERSFASRREHRTGTLSQIHLRGSMEGGTGADVFIDDETHLPPAGALAGRPASCVQQPHSCSRLPRVVSVYLHRRVTPSGCSCGRPLASSSRL